MRLSTTHALAAVAAGLVLALSGCSSGSVTGAATQPAADSGTDTGGDSEKLTHVNFGIFASSAQAALQASIDEGIFADHGIELELVVGQSSNAQLPSLSTGALDFMLASPTTPLVAATQGLDIQIVSGFLQNNPDTPFDSTAVVTGAGSDITSAKDLSGKTVSVNALGGIGEIGISEAVALDGGDPSSINFVQLGFPEVAAQLESGQVDAGMVGSPFTQQVLGAEGTLVSDFIHDTELGANELVIASSGTLTSEDPDTVTRFVEALTEASAWLNDNHPAVAEQMTAILKTPPEVASKTEFGTWSTDIDEPTIQKFADLLSKYDVTDATPDVSKVLWQQ
ncbi:ABC transporter substrate-binding protein [Georgenia sp. EYE_87]|uniref:ABC transporter substrate-binding protein n=1 Tax=Georgenia sp. EYE_87 TaxID=2853448 RepID=UPI0020032BA7|nr:ABC transporter substrate-binding protein [Georgenia sp. EYE_87]MCK6211076.1 ABC transporter substrate-binding protein [Georgenia sp. EYE_87]